MWHCFAYWLLYLPASPVLETIFDSGATVALSLNSWTCTKFFDCFPLLTPSLTLHDHILDSGASDLNTTRLHAPLHDHAWSSPALSTLVTSPDTWDQSNHTEGAAHASSTHTRSASSIPSFKTASSRTSITTPPSNTNADALSNSVIPLASEQDFPDLDATVTNRDIDEDDSVSLVEQMMNGRSISKDSEGDLRGQLSSLSLFSPYQSRVSERVVTLRPLWQGTVSAHMFALVFLFILFGWLAFALSFAHATRTSTLALRHSRHA